ncbi:MAG: alpha/beta hydrolase [Deltaproteobacteria bacterium]|nr:alpha/beta hydrolase [Deltaproteobacteria bacterium]
MRPDRPSDPAPRLWQHGEHRIAYVDEGEGPALLAIHGLPGSHRDFRWLAPALAGRARLVRIDQPCFGGSGDASPQWADVARLLARFAADVIGERHAVLGHSFGGPMATAVATCTAARERVGAIVWLASAGVRPHRAVRQVMPIIGAIDRLRPVPVLGRALLHGWRGVLRASGFPSSITADDVARTSALLSRFDFDRHRRAVSELVERGVPTSRHGRRTTPSSSPPAARSSPTSPRPAPDSPGRPAATTCRRPGPSSSPTRSCRSCTRTCADAGHRLPRPRERPRGTA